ncbi:MAG: diaminopimelate decarboxylase [Puniceicoccales bacterium]|jgi:diaminopimelate decarboxylase|nr:diaminopimelate decarboxylase [Puniceicoccales bacterium]
MQPPFLLPDALARDIAARFGTPAYVYSQAALEQQAAEALAFPVAYGLTVRFAMKALPNASILRLLDRLGLHFDASSGFEATRAILAGIAPGKISLSTQEFPVDFARLQQAGIAVNACSLAQLDAIGRLFPGTPVGVRFNPGKGSGGTGKTNVGGPDASFGIWHEYATEVRKCAEKHGLKITRIHTHIGSGSDPLIWQQTSHLSLALARLFPDVDTLNLGGGYKVARVSSEKGTDLQRVGAPVREAFEEIARETGRKLRLEIEPGTFLVANCGVLLARAQDITDTGAGGRHFLKLDTGMTELLRPSLYGAQHPVTLIPSKPGISGPQRDYVVVGHCCESGDLVSCASGKPEIIATHRFPEAHIGDLCQIGGAGAYCASMSAKNYNSFPEAPEILLLSNNTPQLIRRRQTLAQIMQNEIRAAD